MLRATTIASQLFQKYRRERTAKVESEGNTFEIKKDPHSPLESVRLYINNKMQDCLLAISRIHSSNTDTVINNIARHIRNWRNNSAINA